MLILSSLPDRMLLAGRAKFWFALWEASAVSESINKLKDITVNIRLQ